MSTILERMQLAAARELKQYELAARLAERTGMDHQEALIALRWWPFVATKSKASIVAAQNTPLIRPIGERESLAKACLELIRDWPRYKTVMRYQQGHDVSNEPRDEVGRWTDDGGVGGTKQNKPITTRPSKSGMITDAKGSYVGDFDFTTGWVRRAVRIGDGRVEFAVAPIDDVVKALNRARGPVSSADWNEWFIPNGHPIATVDRTVPGYVPEHAPKDIDSFIPQGELRALSGFDSDGRPREYAASIAGPLVLKLIADVCRGLLEKHVGGKVVGLAVNASGKLVIRIARKGKVVVTALGDNMARRLRQQIDRTAANGTAEARQLKRWLDNNAPIPGWKSTIRKTNKENSNLLRKSLGDALKPTEHAHHIVPSTHKRAVAARELLDRYQIDINDAVNGVPMKRTGPRPAHLGHDLHSHDAIDRVTKRLIRASENAEDWAFGRAKLLKELAKLKGEIAEGAFP